MATPKWGFLWGHPGDASMQTSGGLCTKAWHLDLICKNDYANTVYFSGSFSEAGSKSNVYILSTGVSTDSPYLAERVFQLSGAEDSDGHGTALASIVAGVPYGVARLSQVYGVTLDYTDLRNSLNSAITTVLDHIAGTDKKSVVLIDAVEYPNENNGYLFTGFYDTSMSEIIDRLLDENITTVLCVKEGYTDEDGYQGTLNTSFLPPLCHSKAIIVAGMGSDFKHYSESNYGSDVLLYAPCQDIAVETLERTLEYHSHADYAAAVVAGVCALALSRNPNWGHKQVKVFLEETARRNRVTVKYAGSSDAMYSLDTVHHTDFNGVALTYTLPDFSLLSQSVVNAYFVKNEFFINQDDLGVFNCLSTISIPIDVTSRTVYGESIPCRITLLNSDCPFLTLSKGILYGFAPEHKETAVYNFLISADNGINAIGKSLTLTVSNVKADVKHAGIKISASSKNVLDIDLVVKPTKGAYDLREKDSLLKTTLTRPVKRQVALYDHETGKFSNKGISKPDTGDLILPTNSSNLYGIVVEDLEDEKESNSRIISRIQSE